MTSTLKVTGDEKLLKEIEQAVRSELAYRLVHGPAAQRRAAEAMIGKIRIVVGTR